MTYLHCLQHSLFEHLFNLYNVRENTVKTKPYSEDSLASHIKGVICVRHPANEWHIEDGLSYILGLGKVIQMKDDRRVSVEGHQTDTDTLVLHSCRLMTYDYEMGCNYYVYVH